MGHEYVAKCNKCGGKFNVKEGGGMIVHLLRCDACGKGKWIPFREIGKPHFHYIEGLDRPCLPSAREEYYAKVEEIGGDCECGGIYKFNALPRCPKCSSLDIKDTGKIVAYYD